MMAGIVYDNWPHKHHLVMFAYLSSSPTTTTPRYHGRNDYGVLSLVNSLDSLLMNEN